MNLRTFIDSRGRGAIAELAKSIGAHQPDVCNWANGSRPVPFHWCIAIEQKTGGAVTRQELRPNDWHLIWPELTQSEAA